MTDDSWYGVTHESVAKYVRCISTWTCPNARSTIAQHIADVSPPGKPIIFDVMCGVGGNTIALALSGRWKRVYAIEKDRATLDCAIHNAEIYGVADQITWLHGDCFEILGLAGSNDVDATDTLRKIASNFGVIFASPPWGGELSDD